MDVKERKDKRAKIKFTLRDLIIKTLNNQIDYFISLL